MALEMMTGLDVSAACVDIQYVCLFSSNLRCSCSSTSRDKTIASSPISKTSASGGDATFGRATTLREPPGGVAISSSGEASVTSGRSRGEADNGSGLRSMALLSLSLSLLKTPSLEARLVLPLFCSWVRMTELRPKLGLLPSSDRLEDLRRSLDGECPRAELRRLGDGDLLTVVSIEIGVCGVRWVGETVLALVGLSMIMLGGRKDGVIDVDIAATSEAGRKGGGVHDVRNGMVLCPAKVPSHLWAR